MRPAPAQAAEFGVRYSGIARIGAGNAPAPEGTLIRVITPRENGRFKVCSRGTVAGSQGAYSLEIAERSPCIAETTLEAPTLHLFVIGGENAGSQMSGASRDNPGSLGKERREDLRTTDIPGFDPLALPSSIKIVGVRYYGILTLGRRPARAGTQINVALVIDDEFDEYLVCGVGLVLDDDGHYWVDVSTILGCIAPTNASGRTEHVFLVGGREIGMVLDGASLDQPRSLGKARRIDLHGPRALRR